MNSIRLQHSNKLIFIDTDALTTSFYADFLLTNSNEKKKCHALADAITDMNHFDLVLFMEPTQEFVQDGTRNEKIAANREHYSEQLKRLFQEHDIECCYLSGDYLERFYQAKKLIADRSSIKTVW